MQLDELIICRNWATEAEVREALEYQRKFGDRLESHLYRFGYVSEANLVSALAEQFGCSSVCLSEMTIPDDVIRLVPAELAWSKLVLPFAIDRADNTLKIACENPRRSNLTDDLAAAAPGFKIELYITLGVVLQSALVKHYRQALTESEGSLHRSPLDATSISVPFEVLVSTSAKCRILLFQDDEGDPPALRPMLTHQGFTVTCAQTFDDLVNAAADPDLDAMLLVVPGGEERLSQLLTHLEEKKISIAAHPSYLVVPDVDDERTGELLRAGFEEVIRPENMLDLLMIKLSRFRDRLVSQRNQRLEILQALGTHGSLQDLNVIDLLQAMGTTGKTAFVSVLAVAKQLMIYLDRGRIVYAECEGTQGVDAVYCAVGWSEGVWSVDPIPPEALPEPNIFTTNEAILLEGCHRLDETTRSKVPASKEAVDPLAVFDNLF